MDLRTLIKQYLEDAKLMQLATSIDNQPWVCSVWYAADKDLNIYFFSSTTRRHSKELLKNNKVSAAIVLPQTPEDASRGLQLQGTVEMIASKKEIIKAMFVYARRIFPKNKIHELIKNKSKPHRFYKITPTQYVLFDAVNFPEESRQVLNLQ